MVRTMVPALALVLMATANADTVFLKNGVRFDGVVTPMPGQDGVFKVTAGERVSFYRQSEIDRVEKNGRTGHLDKDAIMKRWEEQNARLTEETGLTADQRRLVKSAMFELKSEDVSVRIAARDKLKAYQEEFDAFGYMAVLYPELSALMAPQVLQALAELDPARSIPVIEEAAQANHYEIRAAAIGLMGRMGFRAGVPLIARGLVDFDYRVQASAAHALALLGVREATPALAQMLTVADLRVSGAARLALETLWQGEWGDRRPTKVSEWDALWSGQGAGKAPIQLASLKLLSPEEEEQRSTYDSNH